MHSSLLHRVHDVQLAACRLSLLYGLARFTAAGILAAMGLGLLDYMLRLHDPITRWLMSVSLVALVVTAFWKLVVPVLSAKQPVVTTARRIERYFPELGERLSSAIAFMREAVDEPTAGSGELRRAVIAEAEARAANVDFGAALDYRAPRRALAAAGIAVAFAATLGAINPGVAGLAASRLIAPWRNLPWPRQHELMFISPPSRLAKGDDFEAMLVDRSGVFPEDLQVQIRQRAASGTAVESRPIRALGGQAIFRLENVTSQFGYRARGGDDDTMPWSEVELVEPPKIVELRIVVRPPAYSGLAPQMESQLVTALIGSTLEIHGKVDQSIHAARLKSVSATIEPPNLEVASDGRTFSTPKTNVAWVVERSGALELELTDDQGIKFGRSARIELHAVVDQPPSIAWEAPEEHVFVTAGAALPIKATVKDDLAVQRVQLRYLRARKSDEEELIELYTGPELAALVQRTSAVKKSGGEAEAHQIHATWDLSRLADLAPGDSLAIRITAEDYKPQFATTSVRRVTVITTEELENRIAAKQAALMAQLAEALRTAEQCREQTQALEARIRESGQASAADRSALEGARHSLRQLQRLLGGGTDGAAGQIRKLFDELATNRLDRGAQGQRLHELLGGVRAMDQQAIPAIEHEFTEALKIARDAENEPSCRSTDADELANRLRKATEGEDRIVQELQRMVGVLSLSDRFGRFAREIAELRDEQERLAAETDDLRFKMVSSDDSSTDRAAGRRLSQRQSELARRVDKLQSLMEQMPADPNAEDASSAAVGSALKAARRLAIGGRMREAASQLSQLRLSTASETEQQVLDALKQLMDTLAPQGKNKTASGNENRAEQAAENEAGANNPSKTGADAPTAARSGENNRRTERGDRQQTESADVKDIVRRIWGHLPEKMRDEMQASLSEQFLPKYERLIEEYYKRLAEERPAAP